MVNGWDKLGEDVSVVTYGCEMTYRDVPEPMSITCTFYKYVE